MTEDEYYTDEASSFAIGFGEFLLKYCKPYNKIDDYWEVVNPHPSLVVGYWHHTEELYKRFIQQLKL